MTSTRTPLVGVVALGLSVALAACSGSKPKTSDTTARSQPRHLTMVGCVRQGATADAIVLSGRSVGDTVEPGAGPERNAVESTETMPGGDADRNRSTGTREDWAGRLTPQLVGSQDFKAELGHQVVVSGTFTPASGSQPLDQLSVESMRRTADNCTAQ